MIDSYGNPVGLSARKLSQSQRDSLKALYVTTYKYDGRGNRIQTKPGSGVTTTVVYDELGRITNTQRTGLHDIYANLKPADLVNGATDKTEYDVYGNVKTYTDAMGRVTKYEYDSFGRLSKKTMPSCGGTNRDALQSYQP